MSTASTRLLPRSNDDHCWRPQPVGWAAELSCVFEHRGGRTVLDTYRHRGPLLVQRPFYPEGELCHVYLLHPPGGIVGGDSLSLRLTSGEGASVLVTTPGANKFYRSNAAVATVRQQMEVRSSACLEWFPQENIFFDGARARLATRVDLSTGGRFLGWEVSCLGRPAGGERFTGGSCDMALEIWRDGRPLLLERQRLGGGSPALRAAWGLNGHDVIASFIATAGDRGDLAAARDCEPPKAGQCAITLVEDLLVARYLGPCAQQAKAYFQALWQTLRVRLLQRAACPPRVWYT